MCYSRSIYGSRRRTLHIIPGSRLFVLLQKPKFKSTSKEHSQCLTRRLKQWEAGDFDGLLCETRTIQGKLPTNSKPLNDERLAKTFSKLMFEGKVNAAMKLLDQHDTGVVTLSQRPINELKRKHPNANDADPSILMDGPLPFVDPVMFQNITESTIMKSVLRTRGSSGPSGLDADGWRRIFVSKNFGNVGKDVHLVGLHEKLVPSKSKLKLKMGEAIH